MNSTKRVFKRKIYNKMLDWKNSRQGSTALLIEGARRIGKSTIVEAFAKQEYDTYILIDFNVVSPLVKSLFDDLTDLNYIFLTLQAVYHKSLKERKSLIIFDEVQQCPKARQAIKYLVADGRYDYIETGSLISIKKNIQDITIPSEEERAAMYPMDYEEFRWALGDTTSIALWQQAWTARRSLGEAAHRVAMRDLRLYMLVGGMPQAVNTYIDTNDLSFVDQTKRQIIKLYADDFKKIDPSGRIGRLFVNIPAQLSRNSRRFIATSVIESSNVNGELITALEESKTVNICYQVDNPQVGMGLTKNDNCYKLYVCDTGLFITLAFWDKDFADNTIYQKLLSDKLPANLGYIYENLVAQMLKAQGHRLFYHSWYKDNKHFYEIDFLLSKGTKICPVEVKSSGYNTHTSMDVFCEKFSSHIGERYLIYTKELRNDKMLQLLPAYMAIYL